jgi:hypothetical protein
MTHELNVTVYDRVYLKGFQQDLALEYLDGWDENGDQLDEWRVIDLATGEVFASDANLHTVITVASEITTEARGEINENWQYVEGKPPISTYRTWDQIPVSDRLRYITSHALDLEHDFRVMGPGLQNGRDPIEVATKELRDMYNEKPCFFLDRDGKWELDYEAAF